MGATAVAARYPSRRAGGQAQGPVVASSPAGSYGSTPDGAAGGGSAAEGFEVAAVDRVLAAAEVVGGVDLEGLSDAQLEVFVAGLRRPVAVLEAARARALAEVERRVRRAVEPDRVTGEVLESRRRAARGQRMSPPEAKRAVEAGTHAASNPATGAAFGAGDIGPGHVRLIGEALDVLPAEARAEAEQELLSLARRGDVVVFGRQVRRYLAAHAPQELHRHEQGRHRQRSFRMADTPDGGVALSGLVYGTAAELARTALDAFRRPDTPDEHRSPQQRGADAFEQLCDAALRLGAAPTIHGERPQVIVVVEAGQLQAEHGTAHLARSGQPITLADAGTLLADCEIARLVRDADGTPLEVSKTVRTVPQGLWRALVVRDGGCRWPGCDAPASWCDVAHGQHPYRTEGRLSPANAVLLCRRHHRRFDHGPWQLHIHGDTITFHREPTPDIHPLDRTHHAEHDEGEVVPTTDDGQSAGPISGARGTGPPDRSGAAARMAADGGGRQEPPGADAPRRGPPTEASAETDPETDPESDPGSHPGAPGDPPQAGPANGSAGGEQLGLIDP